MSREKGKEGENLACLFLEQNGFEIIERNFFAKYGEIDIIATKDDVLHFVEVKSGENFEPIVNLTAQKLQKLIKATHIYLSKHRLANVYCIDALIVKKGQCELIENITMGAL
uniref:UPF0102 protein Helico5904_0130 n=1 Tax=uncultured Helicobacter sp. TaxID=175537 RepID=A0A650EM26_9HELI|nr:UPF0102 protein [uncultured Helicobacter sp.]